jgi:SPW repeat
MPSSGVRKKGVVMEGAKPSAATWLTLVLGIFLLVSPWIVGYAGTVEPMANAVFAGVLIVVLSGLALNMYGRWPNGWLSLVLLNMMLGMEMIVVPQLLKFNDAGTWVQVLIGLAVIVLAVIEMWRVTNPSPRTT